MQKLFSRSWISPVTSVSFIVVAITGVFLAFHIKNGSIKTLHEWLGYVLVLIGSVHFLQNLKPFTAHFRTKAAYIATIACLLLSAVTAFSGGSAQQQAGKHPAIRLLDRNADGIIDSNEIRATVATLNRLEQERKGSVTAEELLTSLMPPKQTKRQ